MIEDKSVQVFQVIRKNEVQINTATAANGDGDDDK